MAVHRLLLTVFLCLIALSPALALDPLPLETVVITTLDVPVDGVHGTTGILGLNTRQQAVVTVPNTPTPSTFVVSLLTRQATPLACPGGETTTSGQSINRRGDVAGFCTVDGILQGFLFRATNPKAPVLLVRPQDAQESQVLGVNDFQHLVGTFRDDNGFLHGFLQRGARLTIVDAPGASDTLLTGINNRGTVVGFASDASGFPQGILGTITDDGVTVEPLNPPGSLLTILLDINDQEDLVGFTVLEDGTGISFARLGGTFFQVEVPAPRLILTDVTGITQNGEIVGRVLLDNFPDPEQLFVSVGFVLTPARGAGEPRHTAVARRGRQAPEHGAPVVHMSATDCEDLPAGKARPAKLGPCR